MIRLQSRWTEWRQVDYEFLCSHKSRLLKWIYEYEGRPRPGYAELVVLEQLSVIIEQGGWYPHQVIVDTTLVGERTVRLLKLDPLCADPEEPAVIR